MTEFLYRTEDIKKQDIPGLFVATEEDRRIIDSLKQKMPTIVVGSRGVGKSFLLRMAEVELLNEIESRRVLPVYISFTRATLIQTSDANQFTQWMLARTCSAIVRQMRKSGLIVPSASVGILSGTSAQNREPEKTPLEEVAEQFENSWRNPGIAVPVDRIPEVDSVKEAVEDICEEYDLGCLALFFDEAAHILRPEQQRQFFTLFRDLRSPYLTCNAAVYPGVTSYGDVFQPAHDASVMRIDRDVMSSAYVDCMREIVEKQADSKLMANIARHRQNFATLAYAANGNPRLLLKTLARTPSVATNEVNAVIRDYYRSEIWAEHTLLGDKYAGFRALIDWGREFMESHVLPSLKAKNDSYLQADKKTTCFFWVHRNTSAAVSLALRLLSYTGIVAVHAEGMKATRAEIGSRYAANLGCLLALESAPTQTGFQVAKNLTPKRMTEFGSNHLAYRGLSEIEPTVDEAAVSAALLHQLEKPVDALDISDWQKSKLRSLDLCTIGDVLRAPESRLKEAYYVGDVRSRQMKNAALAAIYEYLSG